jgi:hypothetical protein
MSRVRMLKKATITPIQPQARQDALLRTSFSARKILNVSRGKSRSWPAQGWEGEISVLLRVLLACGLVERHV